MIYFISDFHFGHKNIIKYSNRPFQSVEEMDEILIKNYNSSVKNSDTCYILGDFALTGKKKAKEYWDRLNGKKCLLIGNHDKQYIKVLPFESNSILIESINSIPVTMCHYPLLSFPHQFHGGIHLYGHTHNDNKFGFVNKTINVCVEAIDYKPISFDEIEELIKGFKWGKSPAPTVISKIKEIEDDVTK